MKEALTFSNILEVVEFLESRRWKIKKSSAYEHARQRKLRPQKDGLYYQKDVEKYARAYLKKRDDPAAPSGPRGLESIQERRNAAEARKIEAQADHWELKSKTASGMYVERGSFERALAQRAMLFKIDLEVFARAQPPEIIRLVGGDPEKTPDLIEFMLGQVASFLARYAEDREFVIPSAAPAESNESSDLENEDEKDEDTRQ